MNKTITLLLSGCFFLIGWQLSAQTVNVELTVDASNETVDATGVHVAGNWDPDNEWNPMAFPMNDNGDGTWSLTIEVMENSTFEYKFLLGNDWGLGNESIPDGSICIVGGGNTNRVFSVDSTDEVLPTVCYNSCAACPGADEYSVSFSVDMANQSMLADSVFIAGGFNNWSNTHMIDYRNDSVYSVALNLVAGDYEYKFKNGNDGWEGSIPAECNVSGNRGVSVIDEDIVLPAVCFEACEPCGGPVEMVDVRFLVNMTNVDIIDGISEDSVHVAGSWQSEAGFGGDWNPGASVMTDEDGDKIYELVVTIPEGTYEYKYLNGNDWGTEEAIPEACKVNGNREMVVVPGNDTMDIGPICFGTCTETCPPVLDPVSVTFRVDMINEFVSDDGVFVTGTILTPAWKRDSLELQEGEIDGIYEYTADLRPGEYTYKFVNGGTEETEEDGDFIAGGCGVDNGFGGSNRLLIIPDALAGADTTLPAYIYNSCDTSMRVTSTNNLTTATNLKLSPNPARVQAILQYDNLDNKRHSIEIFDLSGRKVWENHNVYGNQIRMNISDLNAGVYIGKLSNAKNEFATFRFVVQ
jgi:hypothetical protein